ncbi:cytochrome P450 [Armillaria solidipes]|uniref:Cytochrome P450 n=1 Tax=Armillaria solidipes TaxID=1076256 RepID=A0A2H3B9L0_9AGAR|nr:cytochrome P450 [Armillaria solidipes]
MFLPLLLGATFALHRIWRFISLLKRHDYLKGYRPLFDPYSFPGNAIPTTSWNLGFMWSWVYRRTAHFEHAYDLTTIIPIFGNASYLGASVSIAKQVWGNESKTNLTKPEDFTTEKIFGSSIASANGADWRRHRRVVAPLFNTTMFSTVVKESGSVYRDMVAKEAWKEKNNFIVADMPSLLHRFTLVMICRCGFGMPVEWTQSLDHTEVATFDRELSVAARTIIHRFILPDWVWALPIKSLRAIMQSWRTVLSLMDGIAARRQAEFSLEKDFGDGNITDLLTKLVSVTDGTSKYALEPSEVTANMMSLLFAGNETTGSALLSTLTLLALYPDEQEKAYQEILREAPSSEGLTLNVISSLKHLFACFNEAHRLVPATINLPRSIPEDIVIHSSRPVERDVILRKGSRIVMDMMAILHNPHDFPEPEKFIPSRWYDVPEQDFLMFGFGPRACVGRKFAQTEGVCFLAHFLRDWRVEVVPEVGETTTQMWERVTAGATLFGTAFSLGSVPFKFIARD